VAGHRGGVDRVDGLWRGAGRIRRVARPEPLDGGLPEPRDPPRCVDESGHLNAIPGNDRDGTRGQDANAAHSVLDEHRVGGCVGHGSADRNASRGPWLELVAAELGERNHRHAGDDGRREIDDDEVGRTVRDEPGREKLTAGVPHRADDSGHLHAGVEQAFAVGKAGGIEYLRGETMGSAGEPEADLVAPGGIIALDDAFDRHAQAVVGADEEPLQIGRMRGGQLPLLDELDVFHDEERRVATAIETALQDHLHPRPDDAANFLFDGLVAAAHPDAGGRILDDPDVVGRLPHRDHRPHPDPATRIADVDRE